MRGLLVVDDDVENRVETVRTAECAPQHTLWHCERVWLLATPVEDARDQALLAQPTRLARSQRVTLMNLQTNSFSRHGGGL